MTSLILALGVGVSLAAPGDAVEIAPLWAADNTPWTIGDHHGATGLFRSTVVGLGDKTELQLPGLIGLAAPQVGVKRTLVDGGAWAVGVQGRLSSPSPAMALARGWTFPTREAIPFALQGMVGVMGGYQLDRAVISLGVEGRVAGALTDSDLYQADLYFQDTALAPLLEGPRLTTRAVFDWYPGRDPAYVDAVGVTAQVAAHFGGVGPDFTGKLFGVYRFRQHLLVGAGVTAGYEDLSFTRAFSLAPLLDLQARW